MCGGCFSTVLDWLDHSQFCTSFHAQDTAYHLHYTCDGHSVNSLGSFSSSSSSTGEICSLPSHSSSSPSSNESSSSLTNNTLSSFDNYNVHVSDVHSGTQSSTDGSFISNLGENSNNDSNLFENNEMDDQSSDHSLPLLEYYTTPSVANEGDEDLTHGTQLLPRYLGMNMSHIDNDDRNPEGNLLMGDEPSNYAQVNDTSESLLLNDASFPLHNVIEDVMMDDTSLDDESSMSTEGSCVSSDGSCGWDYSNPYCEMQPSSLNPSEEELMEIIKKGNYPHSLYNEIMQWAWKSYLSGFNFKGQKYSAVMNNMVNTYGTTAGGPPIKSVLTMNGYAPIHVYCFDFLQQAKRVYTDPDLMSESLWGYDASQSHHNLRIQHQLSEMNTAKWWHDTELNNPSFCEENHYLAPVILFDDATQCDALGWLKAHPILMSFGNINGMKCHSSSAWFLLGIVPPYPKTAQEWKADSQNINLKEDYLKYYHHCLKCILHNFISVSKNSNGVRMYVYGKGEITLHFELAFVIGDTEGQDRMCSHYGGYSSDLCHCMMHDCNIPASQGDDLSFECSFTRVDEIVPIVCHSMTVIQPDNRVYGGVTAARTAAANLSQHLVESVYFGVSFGGDPHGIFGSTPVEILHFFYKGIMQLMLKCLYNYTPVPPTLKSWYTSQLNGNNHGHLSWKPAVTKNQRENCLFNLAEFERHFRCCTKASWHQSDRSMPWTPFKHGVTSLSRMNGQEMPGLCLLTMITLEGMIGSSLEERLCERKFCTIIWLSLSLETLLSKEEFTEDELVELEMKITIFLKCYSAAVGYQAELQSRCGLRITKFHALKHIPFYVCRYGSTHNFFGGYLESALKPTVKNTTPRTSQQHHRFDADLMNHIYEQTVVEISEKVRNSQAVDCNFITNMQPLRDLSIPPQADISSYQLGSPLLTINLTKDGTWVCSSLPDTAHDFYQRCFYQQVTESQNTMQPWVSIICQYGNIVRCQSIEIHTQCTWNMIDSEKVDKLTRSSIMCQAHYMSTPEWLITKMPTYGAVQKTLIPAKPLVFAHFMSESGSSVGVKCLIMPMILHENRRLRKHQISNPWAYKEWMSHNPQMLDISKITQVKYRIQLGDPPFHAKKDVVSGTWKTCTLMRGPSVWNNLYHPHKDDNEGRCWMQAICDVADSYECVHVEFFMKCSIPSDSGSSILCCNPDFHSYPWEKCGWFDWVLIRWVNPHGTDDDATYLHAAKLLLFGCIADPISCEEYIKCVVQPLQSTPPILQHHFIPWMKADTLSEEICVVDFESIEEVTFVLPAMPPPGSHLHINHEQFPDNPDENRYYIVIPPHSKWGEIGWDQAEKIILG